MTLQTAFTELFSVEYPTALAPMGGCAGGALAAAVSAGGTVLDIARGVPWPARYSARTLRHPFVERWRGREDQLAGDDDAKRAYRQGVESGELPAEPIWASEAIDLITDLRPAADLVGDLAAEAAATLARLRG